MIYTLPIAFLLVNNAMKQIDQRYVTVSRLMQDGALRRFTTTVLRPLLGTLTIAWIQSFFLSFTDFGIPASVGGSYEVIASLLYSYMLGSIPDFAKGSIIAMVMLVPSIISILLMRYMERYDIRYQHVSQVRMPKSKARDLLCGTCSIAILIALLSVFAVIFLLPFISQWPYQITFTWSHVQAVFGDETLVSVIKNTLLMALCTSLAGTLLAYGGALVSKRSRLHHRLRHLIDSFALITNTIPGMVIGIAYLFVFTKTPLQNTLALMVLCNVVHFFSTPYLMMKETLGKMNASFETSGKLLGDTWLKTIVRIITPNALSSLIEVFAYYFVNSMVTVSAIIFIAGARTMVVTTKIKELQYFAKFNEIFVLSLFILFANLFVKLLCAAYGKRREKTYEKV